VIIPVLGARIENRLKLPAFRIAGVGVHPFQLVAFPASRAEIFGDRLSSLSFWPNVVKLQIRQQKILRTSAIFTLKARCLKNTLPNFSP
jgi:hypothetical protein